jgi:hypothetical protein
MPVDVAPETGGRLAEALGVLLAAEPYLPYASFPPIAGRPGPMRACHSRRFEQAANAEGVLVARYGGRPVAAIALTRRAFESEHFAMPIAGIDGPLAVADDAIRLAALRALYEAARRRLSTAGFVHLSAVASTHDRAASWALQEAGCFHVGTRISWMAPLTGERTGPALAPPLRIEVLDRASLATLRRADWQRLLDWTGQAFDRGPFVFDLAVPRERAAAVYRVWTEKAFTGEWADVVLVVRDGDEVVAYNTMQWLPDLSEAAGVGILGRGIGGSLPGYSGSFTALQRECAAVRPLGASYLENETQAATIGSINAFGRLGHRCFRSVASFHGRLGAAPRTV